ncbi:MAG: type IV conjugative transfer system lipoprotein TraV [Gammaproteobacteria bacterium]|nr:type IV conjugative transfer system lipoprotein TraV [Gammaproteobacteria bacterium]MCD8542227.1 type IV conjugative transfer system lipoprotein TraV [Gammaproteobacteria bacterium]MCD8573778.1 type IV conjugative transfer system lipoprotein TraV [Gammaproteobacteria bacterium]
MKHSLKITVLLSVLSLGLTGCAEMNSDFTCPMTNGMQCKRIDQVNGMVDQGAIDTTGQDAPTSSAQTTGSGITPDGNVANAQFIYPYPKDAEAVPGQPLRYGESVMRLWIAPYEDTQDNYHAPSIVYTVVKSGHWTGIPVEEIKDND